MEISTLSGIWEQPDPRQLETGPDIQNRELERRNRPSTDDVSTGVGRGQDEEKASVKVYECVICGQEFKRSSHLNYHMNRHLKLKPYACNKCDFKSAYPSNLSKHKVVHSGIKPFACDLCQYRTARRRNLKEHLTGVHAADKHFKCVRCEYRSANPSHLKKHHELMHSIWKCNECDCEVEGQQRLEAHTKIHKGGFACDQCHFVTRKARSLRWHFFSHHTGCLPFPCDKCPLRAPTRPFLMNHKLIAHPDKSVEDMIVQAELDIRKCGLCDYQTFSMPELQDHVTEKHGSFKHYPCVSCGYIARGPQDLKDHIMIHTGERPFACFLCNYRSRTKSHMNVHLTIHSGLKPFACDDCDYRGSNKSLLYKHRRSMHNAAGHKIRDKSKKSPEPESTAKVTTGKITFGWNTGLSQVGNNPSMSKQPSQKALKTYNCNKCSFCSTTSKDLKNHVLSVHHRPYLVFSDAQSTNSGDSKVSEKVRLPSRGKGKSIVVNCPNDQGLTTVRTNPGRSSRSISPSVTEIISTNVTEPTVQLKAPPSSSRNPRDQGSSGKTVSINSGVQKKNNFLEIFENFLEVFS